MAVRTTVDIPDTLHDSLRHKAHESGTSIRALIVSALEQVYSERKGRTVTGPLVKGPAKPGPRFPKDENPHDLILP